MQTKQKARTRCLLNAVVIILMIYFHTIDTYVKGIMDFVGRPEAEAKAEAEEVKHSPFFPFICFRSIKHATRIGTS